MRQKYKKKYFGAIEEAMKDMDKFSMETFEIHVKYNCRFDVDNAICCCKFLADYLRHHDYVKDDNPKFFKKQSTEYDPEIEKDTFVAKIKGYGYQVAE